MQIKMLRHTFLFTHILFNISVEIIEIKAVNPNSTESAESLETHNDISTPTNTHEDNNMLHLQNNLRSINSTTSYGTNDSGKFEVNFLV